MISAASARCSITDASRTASIQPDVEHVDRDRGARAQAEVDQRRGERALVLVRERADRREHGDADEQRRRGRRGRRSRSRCGGERAADQSPVSGPPGSGAGTSGPVGGGRQRVVRLGRVGAVRRGRAPRGPGTGSAGTDGRVGHDRAARVVGRGISRVDACRRLPGVTRRTMADTSRLRDHPAPGRSPRRRSAEGSRRRRGLTAARRGRAGGHRGRDGGATVEVEVEGRTLSLSNLDKVFYPATGFTKGQVIDYYTRIAPVLLPHLRARHLTLKRYPDGVEGPYFYEKQCPGHRPDWVRTAGVVLAPQRARDRLLPGRRPRDARLARQPRRPRDAHAARPRRRAEGADDDRVRPRPRAARDDRRVRRGRLPAARRVRPLRPAVAFPKTSGSKGMQLYVPLNTPATYGATKPFAQGVAQVLERRHPELVVSEMRKDLRPGKVLIDWSQNDEHKTTVCVYSLRARERPTVSTPVTWDEVEGVLRTRDPDDLAFTPTRCSSASPSTATCSRRCSSSSRSCPAVKACIFDMDGTRRSHGTSAPVLVAAALGQPGALEALEREGSRPGPPPRCSSPGGCTRCGAS